MAQAARMNLRMQKELKLLLTDPPPGASFPQLSGDFDVSLSSLSSIDAQIEGPEGTVYANGIFKVKIHIPERYPFQPPSVTLATPIYHPNIDTGGRICLDILNLPPNGAWQPSLNISSVLTSIRLLLSEPNPDDGLMCEVSREYKYDRPVFDQKAKSMTETYAKVGASGTSSQIIQTDTNPSKMEVKGMDIVPKHEVHEDNCNHSKPSGICQKLSWESSGSMQKKEVNGEVSGLPYLSLENQTVAKRPKKEPKGAVHDSNPSHEKLGMSRRRLSLESIHKTKKRDYGYDKENDVPNYSPSLLNSQSTSLGSELLLVPPTGNHYVEQPQKDQGSESNDCSSFSSGKPCWIGQKLSLESSKVSNTVSSNDDKIIESHQLSSFQRESTVPHKALPTIQTIEHNGLLQNKGCVNGTGHEFTNSKQKKQHSSGKKLSLGLLGSRKTEDSNKNEDHVLTDKVPLSHPSGPSLDSLKQQSNGEDEAVDVPGAEESRMPETIIVLDSEDSDEERNVSQRSRLPLACKRLAGKWRAKA